MNRNVEKLINAFGELTPQRHTEKFDEFTKLYQNKGINGIDQQSYFEVAKTGAATTISAVLGGLGIDTAIIEFQKGNITEATAGLLATAVAIKMAQTAVRTTDNTIILLEVEKEQTKVLVKNLSQKYPPKN